MKISTLLVCGAALAAPAVAQDGFDRYALVGSYGLPSAGAFQDAFDAATDGRILFLAANDVYLETAPGARRFEPLGPLTGEGAPVVFPAFIRVRPDGRVFAVGNNAGKVGVFDVGSMEGAWFSAAHFDADWFDDRHLVVREGATVTLLDTQSPPQQPVNPVLISNCPIAAGIGFDDAGNLFTGNGLDGPEPSGTGWIMYFAHDRWRAVLDGAPVIDFEAEGLLVVDLLSATSIGFDAEGNLHTGGGDFDGGDLGYLGLVSGAAVAEAIAGRGPADPQDPRDVRKLDPDENDPDNWYDAAFNRPAREMLVRDAATSNVYVYAVAGHVTCDDVRRLTAGCRPEGRVKVQLRLRGGGRSGEAVYATVDGVPLRSVISGGRARWRSRGWSAGSHEVDLSSPAGCGRGVRVVCE